MDTKHLCEICSGKYPDAIFVFGSNEMGIHGAGAASHALSHGAEISVGYGPRDKTFAIPTKNWHVETLPLDRIKGFVDGFLDYATKMHNTKFYITRIGCGFAGYTDSDIAPMFKYAPKNCIFPMEWVKYL